MERYDHLRTSAALLCCALCCHGPRCLLAQSFAGELSPVPIRRLELCCGWLCYGASVECPEIVDKMLLPECCESLLAAAEVYPSRIAGARNLEVLGWPGRAVSESDERGERACRPGRKYMALAMAEPSECQK